MNIAVQVMGPDVAGLIAASVAKIEDSAELALDLIASDVQADGQANCPVAQDPKRGEIPGTLRDDIKIYPSKLKRVIGNMNVLYAIYVHNGTWKMKARPYLFNASEANKNNWIAYILANPGV